jgi:hypothetical protein
MADYLRGHKIEKVNNQYVYSDTKEPTAGNVRNCGYCGLPNTKEGHDGCLSTLKGAMNACCGHGHEEAYVQFENGMIIRGRFEE